MVVPGELTAACSFAYDCLRRANADVVVPPAMRSFLHHSQLSPRAITVAKSALDSNPEFRASIAQQATVAHVGKEGWLWLHRVPGTPPPPPPPPSDRPAPPRPRQARAAVPVDEIDRLHRRIAELERDLEIRTDEWRSALQELSATQEALDSIRTSTAR